MKRAWILLLVVASVHVVHAQTPPAPSDPLPGAEGEVLTAAQVTAGACDRLDLTPGAMLQAAPQAGALATPIPWSELDIEGTFVDDKKVVLALLEPTMQQLRTSLSTATMPQVAALTARFGYQLVGHITRDVPNGTKLVLHLQPLPLVRKVDVHLKQGFTDKLFDDEIRRRISFRSGTYLPWDPTRRNCTLDQEKRRLEEFLADEGYLRADVRIAPTLDESSATIDVYVELNKAYKIGTVSILCPAGYERRKGVCVDPATNTTYTLAIPEAEIKQIFVHKRCLIGKKACWFGPARFTRAQFQEDLQKLKERFHAAQFPGVRITASDLAESVDRKEKLVNPKLTIDQRRQVFVEFKGYDTDRVTDQQLRDQLTFDDAGSADDVEAADSARELTTYLQTRGFFDAHVTWVRERFDNEPRPGTNEAGTHFDRITFTIDASKTRRVALVEFVGNKKLTESQLRDLVATKQASVGAAFLGTTASPTSVELIADQERIKEAYRRVGYPEARVVPSVSPSRAGLDNPALTAALLGVDDSDSLYVRFTITEGPPTLLTRVVVQLDGGGAPDAALCAEALGELAKQIGDSHVALPTDKDKCAATLPTSPGFEFRADAVASTRDGLRNFMFKTGRARAHVDYAAVPIGPSRVEARYTLKGVAPVRLGKVVIRGNFRTRSSIIWKQLDFDENDLLTSDRLATGARKLRNMGLFETVNLDMPDLDCDEDRQCSSEVVNAVVRVEERYPHRAELGVEGGYSYVNGLFGTLRPLIPNIFGLGLRFSIAGTYGQKLKELEARFTIPPYLVRPFGKKLDLQTDLTALYRIQDTVRFGVLKTQGAGIALSKAWWTRPHTPSHSAAALTGGPFYDFHVRSHNVDATRPIGADMDDSQVAISTRTGAVGFRLNFENRVSTTGQLSPLAPEAGMYAELTGSVAHPYFGGQDRFLKLSAAVSKFQTIRKYILLRADARYDQGIPFGSDRVLLPDVERFFAGGDNTVRGYADDRLAYELIQVAVPPFDNVTQIRVIPAPRNIRTLASLDAQARIWHVTSGFDLGAALFTDAGLLTNSWKAASVDDIRPSVGMGLRALTPFGIGALEYAIPLRPQLGDDPRGRIHFYFAARAQF